MREPINPPENSVADLENEKAVSSLLQKAGHRPDLPEEDLLQIKQAAKAEWRRHLSQKKGASEVHRDSYKWAWSLAAAAMILLALGIGWRWSLPSDFPSSSAVAQVQFVQGAASLFLPGADPEPRSLPLANDSKIPPGSILEIPATEDSGGGLVALKLTSGASLRLAAGSRLRAQGPSKVALERGLLYFDEDPTFHDGLALEVETPYGTVRHIGTQFEVKLSEQPGDQEANLRLRVREGLVEVDFQGTSHRAEKGIELAVFADGSTLRQEILSYGPHWQWIQNSAPVMEIEGTTAFDYLRWVARETGLELIFTSSDLKTSAGTTILHGSIQGLQPQQSLAVVLPGCDLQHHITDGRLEIRSL
ncbi:MAG: FecR family protein [Deltaproteobacteria bacterium]|nr:FecR family protein [Deltaproteobacteria bacterium]